MFKLVVLSTLLAAATASGIAPWGLAGPLGVGPLGVGPLGLGVGHLGLGGPWAGAVAAPWAGAAVAAPLGAWGAHVAGPLGVAAPIGAYNYRGPLSLAPGQPANILAADGRPLDTLSVNLDRAAHITAKAVSGAHLLKKRSAPLLGPVGPLGYASLGHVGPVAVSHTSRIDLPSRLIAAAPLGHGPLGLAPAPLGVHGAIAPWGLGLGLGHGLW